MKAIMEILGQELALLARLDKLAQAQRQHLKENLNGKAVREATEDVNKILAALAVLAERKTQLLQKLGFATMAEAVTRFPFSEEKLRAQQFLARITELLTNLKTTSIISKELLQRNMQYLSYSLNVMTQAQAGTTYQAPDAPRQAVEARKLFDQSV